SLLCSQSALSVFFFFQAEDGIRDWSVTGVQTCALPISPSIAAPRACARPGTTTAASTKRDGSRDRRIAEPRGEDRPDLAERTARSEERRVGKECRSRWSPDD